MPSDKVKDRLRKARAASKRKVVDYGQHPLIRDQERRGMPRAELGGYRPRVVDWAKDTFGGENVQHVIKDRIANPGKILSAPVVAAMGAVEGVKNAAAGVKYFLDPKTAPHPGDRRADAMSARKAFNVASMAGSGVAVAKVASKAKSVAQKELAKVPEATSKVSKPVRRRDAKPIRAYHGTISDFKRFDPRKTEFGPHFGTRRAAEDTLLKYSDTKFGNKKRILEVDLNIRNPIEVRDAGHWNADSVGRLIKENKLRLTKKEIDLLDEYKRVNAGYYNLTGSGNKNDIYNNMKLRNKTESMLRKALRRNGYDGIKYTNRVEDEGSTSYIAIKRGTVKDAKTGKTLYSSGVPGLYVEDERKNTAERLRTARQRARHGKR